MPGLIKIAIFLLVFAGVTAAVWSFIVPDENPTIRAKGKINNEHIDFSVTGNKAALETDMILSKILSLAIGFLVGIISLFIL